MRQLIALNRQLHSYAKLKRNVYRLAIALDAENSTWWVEKKIKDEEAKQIQEQLKNTDPVPTFMLDPEFVQKPQKLPEGLSFASVEFRTGENKILSEGEAYIPYFPEGQFNQAIIKIKGQKQYWSLFVDRFRGEARIFSGEKTFEDLKQ